jgi:hypothetical protein
MLSSKTRQPTRVIGASISKLGPASVLGDRGEGVVGKKNATIVLDNNGLGHAVSHSMQRPSRRSAKLIAQSAGWMASRQEILDLNRMCRGGFLPPFEGKHMPQDGLGYDVEFWSGGIQMYSDHCNIHRIAPLNDPDAFSRHLLYHTANNKHYQGNIKDRLLRIDDLMGQMNTVQKVAQQRMEKMIRQTKKALR